MFQIICRLNLIYRGEENNIPNEEEDISTPNDNKCLNFFLI